MTTVLFGNTLNLELGMVKGVVESLDGNVMETKLLKVITIILDLMGN